MQSKLSQFPLFEYYNYIWKRIKKREGKKGENTKYIYIFYFFILKH